MPTPSALLRLMIMGQGESLNAWGDPNLNEVLKRLEEAIAGANTIALGTATTYDLSAAGKTANYITDESRKAFQIITGTPASAVAITTPDTSKAYLVVNNCGQAVTFTRSSGGTGAVVRAGRVTWVRCDGTAWTSEDPTLDQIKSAAADVSLNSHKLTSVADPTLPQDAATKNYVDVPSADRDMNGKKITTLGTPTVATDATTKAYVDSIAFNGGLPAGTAAGQLIFYNGASGAWTAAPTSPGQFPYFVSGAISFVPAPTSSGQAPIWNGSSIAWSAAGAPDYLLQAQGII